MLERPESRPERMAPSLRPPARLHLEHTDLAASADKPASESGLPVGDRDGDLYRDPFPDSGSAHIETDTERARNGP